MAFTFQGLSLASRDFKKIRNFAFKEKRHYLLLHKSLGCCLMSKMSQVIKLPTAMKKIISNYAAESLSNEEDSRESRALRHFVLQSFLILSLTKYWNVKGVGHVAK